MGITFLSFQRRDQRDQIKTSSAKVSPIFFAKGLRNKQRDTQCLPPQNISYLFSGNIKATSVFYVLQKKEKYLKDMCTQGIIVAQKIKHTHTYTHLFLCLQELRIIQKNFGREVACGILFWFFLQIKPFSLCVSLLLRKEKPMRDNINGLQILLSLNLSFLLHSEIAYGFVP